MSQIPRTHLTMIALGGLAIYGLAILAFYPIACSSQEREAGIFPSSVPDGSSTPNPASPSSPIPTALADPDALTSNTPARAPLGEPASPTLSPSSFPSVAEGQVSLLTLDGELGKWVKDYVGKHPNGPWIKIPQGSREMDIRAFAVQMKLIIEECEEANALLLRGHGDNLLAFSSDPRVRQNDRDRQQKLKDLLNSIWPGSME